MYDHRQIANQLDLFHFEPISPGMVFWHPSGWRLYRRIQDHVRQIYHKSGFREVRTPEFLKREVWETSGHWEKFSENMFVGGGFSEDPEYALKPMSCPGHIHIYKKGVHSYRNLPYRVFEFGTVYRNEPSGSLNGCMRLRQFTQDDAHVFCRWDQALDEIAHFFQRVRKLYHAYGFKKLDIKIATRPKNSFGAPEQWQRAEELLAQACRQAGLPFDYHIGEGAFYGPKIELAFNDMLGREWQCGTIQLDFNMPAKFGLSYRDENHTFERPVILHQALLGSLERWIGILLESSQGALPTWLAPIPVAIASIDNSVVEYVANIEDLLQDAGHHVESDISSETISRKIKRFADQKVPIILVIGQNELQQQSANLRLRGSNQHRSISLPEFMVFLEKELAMPKLNNEL